MWDFLVVGAFLMGVIGMCYGLYLLAFRSGSRKRGLKIFVLSPIVAIACSVAAMSAGQNEKARAAGWVSASERSEATRLGIAEPAAFEALKDQRLAEERAAEAERLALAAAAKQAEDAAKEARAAEDKRYGFHCLTGWDGSHRPFSNAVKAMMRDPESFEHIKTTVGPVDDKGLNSINMQYRARNGFGGMNVSVAVGVFSNDTCQHRVVAVE